MDRRWLGPCNCAGNRYRKNTDDGLDESRVTKTDSRNRTCCLLVTFAQKVVAHDIRLDCDNDVILLEVEQKGGIACHTGRHNCFFKQLKDNEWMNVDPVIKDPDSIYKK